MDAITGRHERERVQQHILRAEQAAREQAMSELTPMQWIVRSLLLDVLADYRMAGVFPENIDFAEQLPHFVDGRGVRCAMAHLLEAGGEHQLVQKIARERNNAFVRELADEPRLIAWLIAAGLTVQDAAMIQPGYCPIVSGEFCFGTLLGPVLTPAVPLTVPRVVTVARGEVSAVNGATSAIVVHQVWGDCSQLFPGDSVDATLTRAGSNVVGQQVLVSVLRQPNGTLRTDHYAVPIAADGRVHSVLRPLSLTPDALASANLSSDCTAYLAELDPAWSERRGCLDAGATTDAAVDARAPDAQTVSVCINPPRPRDASATDSADATATRAMDAMGHADAQFAAPMDAMDATDGQVSMRTTAGGGCSAALYAPGQLSTWTVLASLLGALISRAHREHRVNTIRRREG